MKLTPFGHEIRVIRMSLDLSLKEMAESIGVTSSYLSAIEFGERRLTDQHVNAILDFLGDRISSEAKEKLLKLAGESKTIVNTEHLDTSARGLVAAFARRLSEEGGIAPKELANWIYKKKD